MNSHDDDITRREWLLRLGGTACLLGFRGIPGEHSLSEALKSQATTGSAGDALPPGLYDPSSDQMTHALMSDERFRTIPAGCETDFVTRRNAPFEPQFFSTKELATVRRLVGLVLGEGGTPSVSKNDSTSAPREDVATEIAEWIDLVLSNAPAVREAARNVSPQHRALATAFYGPEVVQRLENAEPDKIWREGVSWLTAESQNRYAAPFVELSAAQATEMLTSVSDARPSGNGESAGTRFFQLLKEQTVQGFYTSQRGLKELDFKGNSFYAECPGCTGRPHS